MPWFINREDAEALLATIDRNPDWSYTILLNGCGPGWGIEVRDDENHLITEAYSPEEIAGQTAEHEARMQTERARIARERTRMK